MERKKLATKKEKKLYVLDMDGTIYLGKKLFPETIPFLKRVRKRGKRYIFFTNNSSRSTRTYVDRLNSMGIPATLDDILTSGDVTAHFLLTQRQGKRVYLVGTKDLEESFLETGVPLVQENPDIVLIAFDTSLTYEKLDKACKYIREGAEFLCTHEDLNCPIEGGWMPDAGAICALITASTGQEPRYLGKPHYETLQLLMDVTGVKPEEMVIVGDRLYTDIALGTKNGVTAVLVLTGETKEEDLATSKIQPDLVVDSIGGLERE
ncbi:MAG: HAD-IIA family hydrolase [Epulopiscium sp.]|nr:HAD-IIA family hydrolase [Candidatus Epulonipiscium sp.]